MTFLGLLLWLGSRGQVALVVQISSPPPWRPARCVAIFPTICTYATARRFWAPAPSTTAGRATVVVFGAAQTATGSSSSSSVPGGAVPPASSASTPYTFPPSGSSDAAAEVGGQCARAFAAVAPADATRRIVGAAAALSGDLVPAAGKVICGSESFNFTGSFGPLPAGAGCGEAYVSKHLPICCSAHQFTDVFCLRGRAGGRAH